MDAARVTIKTTGQKQDSALNGIPRDLAKTHSSFSTTENQVCIILVGNSNFDMIFLTVGGKFKTHRAPLVFST